MVHFLVIDNKGLENKVVSQVSACLLRIIQKVMNGRESNREPDSVFFPQELLIIIQKVVFKLFGRQGTIQILSHELHISVPDYYNKPDENEKGEAGAWQRLMHFLTLDVEPDLVAEKVTHRAGSIDTTLAGLASAPGS